MLKIANSKAEGALYNAFTLVELIGVIIVLGVIALITYPIIDKSIKNSKDQALERIIDNIEEAAYSYSVEHDIGYPTKKTELYLNEIQGKGYLNTKIINPVTNEEMSGCVWYYWNEENKQYIFEYDSECKKTDDPPEVNIVYNNELINNNGWAKENISVSITGIGEIKYCIGNSECEPNDIIETGNNTKFITIEGINYICAIASNSLGSSEKKCEVIKLDKTIPNIEGIGDKVVQKNEVVNLKENVTANDSLSGIDGEIIIEPSSIDTSITGTKKVTYKVKDKAGNEREVIRNIIVDAEAPTIVYNLVNPSSINSNGWAKENFYVRATITDNSGSGIKVAKSCTSNSSSECVPTADISGTTKDFYIEVEGSNRLCIEVTDNNNKTTKICSDTYKLDKTAPVAGTANLVGTLGSNAWYTSDVTVNVVNGSDSLSGHLSTTSNTSKITTNSTGTTVIITTTDLAGNSATRSYTIKLDKNSPTLTDKGGSVTIYQGDSYIVSNYFNVGYSISGGSISCNPANTNSLGVGTQTVSCTATGGNGKSVTASKRITIKTKPVSFATDSWETIADAVRNNNTSMYNVGDTKEVTVSGYGTFTVRIANKSTPSECATSGFSQTACGFVVEFVDIITPNRMNYPNDSIGGWQSTELYSLVNTTIYNNLSNELKNVIINTFVVSSHGKSETSNFTSTDKLYLLSPKEVWDNNPDGGDTSTNLTRQLDYYKNNNVTIDNYLGAIKYYQENEVSWWLRTAYYFDDDSFYYVEMSGKCRQSISNSKIGVSPAFRIG